MEQITVKAHEQARPLRAINRAISDLRRGVPVAIVEGNRAFLTLSCEILSADTVAEAESYLGHKPHIYMSQSRAHGLNIHANHPVVGVIWPKWLGVDDIIALADPTLDLAHPFKGPFERIENAQDETLALNAIELAKAAQLLPAVVGGVLKKEALSNADILSIQAEDIIRYQRDASQALTALVDAHVPLEGAEDARVFIFRPQGGGVEHLAIVIGDPPRHQPVLTRLHSECLTGDVLGSLKCDCGDQLRGAIAAIGHEGRGVLLYLAQEGRGIGLTNKLRAYKLQDQGFDTVDANLRLGFGVDERLFAPAAIILRKLGFSQIKLMTNNPKKVEAMQNHGITVTKRVAHQFPSNTHNEGYLETKGRRTGHILK